MVKKPGEFGSDEAADLNEDPIGWRDEWDQYSRSIHGGGSDVNGRAYPRYDVGDSRAERMAAIRADEAWRKKVEAAKQQQQSAAQGVGETQSTEGRTFELDVEAKAAETDPVQGETAEDPTEKPVEIKPNNDNGFDGNQE